MLIKYCGEMTVCTECCYVWGEKMRTKHFGKKLGVLPLQFWKKMSSSNYPLFSIRDLNLRYFKVDGNAPSV